jgi:hypothetical protein
MIDNTTFTLNHFNYVKEKTLKNKIVIGSTNSKGMNHFIGWKTRWGGNYTRTAMFTITINGEIYQHFDDTYFSNFLGIHDIDPYIISIVLENQGWLQPLNDVKSSYITYTNTIYKGRGKIFKKRWRNREYWAPYTKKQYNSLKELVNFICEKHKIKLNVVPHNLNINEIKDFNGITYKSNYNKFYTDINPSWEFEKFKQEIENG